MTPAAPDSPELRAYFADRRTLAVNLVWINVLNIGWGLCFTVVSPLMLLHVNASGVHEGAIGTVGFCNAVVFSFLVMYLSWKSDGTITRFGRRVPYLFVSIPFIAGSIVLFPFFRTAWVLVTLWILQALFMDVKAATIPLLSIDCVPRAQLARWAAVGTVVGSGVNWAALRWGLRLADTWEKLPYLLSALVLIVSAVGAAVWIKEPPVRPAARAPFRPWSAIAIACRDRRKILLMASVAMIASFNLMYNSWIWLHARNKLGLTRGDLGEAFSWSFLVGAVAAYPVGWIVDRTGRHVGWIFFGLMAVMLYLAATFQSKGDLVVLALLTPLATQLYGGVDMLVYRWCDPAEVGSVTSTNSSLRQFYLGTLTFLSGYLIEWGGHNYVAAYVVGFAMVAVGLAAFYLYWHLVDQAGKKLSAPEPKLITA